MLQTMAWEAAMKPLLGRLREGTSVQRVEVETALQGVPSAEAPSAPGEHQDLTTCLLHCSVKLTHLSLG